MIACHYKQNSITKLTVMGSIVQDPRSILSDGLNIIFIIATNLNILSHNVINLLD